MTEAQIQAMIELARIQLAAMLASPKPSYSVGEHFYSWTEYQDMLMRTIQACQAMLTNLPCEEETIWRSA